VTFRPSVPRNNVLDGVGNTPLINLGGVWAKLEYRNPSGSVKARLAVYVIERAQSVGLLQPGDTIVEASSGNTGNAMSMVAAALGYRMIVVMPKGVSRERAAMSRAFGAQVIEIGDFHVNAALELARELGKERGCFAPQQFDSEWNIEENRDWLGPEILRQLPSGTVPGAFVMGVGTGGTLVGVGQAFRSVNPAVRLIAVEPSESCTIRCGEIGRHSIEGISDGFVPNILERNRHLIDAVVSVTSADALAEMRSLARNHGLFVGPSSGAHVVSARRLLEHEPQVGIVITVLPDEGEKYLSDFFA
jgi:cysteine synthase